MTEIARINFKTVEPGAHARYQTLGTHLDIEVTNWIDGEWKDYMKVPRWSGYDYQSRHWVEIPQFELFTKSDSEAWNILDQMTKRGGHYLIVNRQNRTHNFQDLFCYTIGIAWCKEPFLHPSIEIKDSYPIWCPIKL